MFDLVIRGGTVVNAGGSERADVAVAGERIAAVESDLEGRRYIEAAGRLVLPGGVDPHVHFTAMQDLPPGWPVRPDDFETGTRAALAGGITTIGNMTHQVVGQTLGRALERDDEVASRTAVVDYVLHPVVNDASEAALGEIGSLRARGVGTVKVFLTAADPGFIALEAVMRRSARGGVTVMAHCEDAALIADATSALLESGRSDASGYPAARPVASEVAAVRKALEIAGRSGCTLYVVHLASSEALRVCEEARAGGTRVTIETRPIYLHLTDEVFSGPDGAKYVGNPPIRSADDQARLWEGMAAGTVEIVATDHAPWTLEQKLDPGRDLSSFLPGMAELETLRPMLFSAGVRTGRISQETFVAVTAANAARALGIYPRKGVIAPGSDADILVLDPEMSRVVDGGSLISRAGHSVYDGWEVAGWPEVVVSRGLVVKSGDEDAVQAGRGMRVLAAP